MPNSSSDSDDDRILRVKPFGRQRPIRDILGGGKVADVLLWKDKAVSAGILVGIGVLWYLFEVIGYSFLTLLCHIILSAMLIIIIWIQGSDIFQWPLPTLDIGSEKTKTRQRKIVATSREIVAMCREIIPMCRAELMDFLLILTLVACGNFGVIVSLLILAAMGNYISTLNLLFFGCLCLETLPYLYDKYEQEVDYLIAPIVRWLKKLEYTRSLIRILSQKFQEDLLKRRNTNEREVGEELHC